MEYVAHRRSDFSAIGDVFGSRLNFAAGGGTEFVLRISLGFCMQKSLKLPSSLPLLSTGG